MPGLPFFAWLAYGFEALQPLRFMRPKTFEAHCLRLPAATKVVQWEGTSVFKVGGKMFALAG
ncbi:MAG TPA: hypothetical protein VF583_14475, partial [Bradyrhizobium sp.]